MKPSIRLDENREAIRAAVVRRRAANPRVFGSVLHGTDRDDSDIDFLVDAPAGTSLLALCGLENDLEDLLGVPVHVLTPGDISKRLRDKIVAEAQPV
ncbi:MAG: nucleotidyltransferase family protein [Planctomycetes bacterium]|nr:nucleotidyltransferase family protein [Planctomycetota bacterium]